MTENVCNLLDNLTKHNSRAFGYELSQNEILQILKLLDDVKELKQYRAIGTVEELKSMKENGAFTGVELASLACMQMKLKDYQAIGTIEEFKALKEKMQDAEIMIIDRMQEFYNEYRSISQSSVDHFGGKADAIETSQQIVKGVFKDVLGIDWH